MSVSEFHEGNVFSEIVKINKVRYLCECVNDSEKTIVRISTSSQYIELDKINDTVLRFIQLFTLVSYKRVTCSSMHIVDDGKKYNLISWQCKPFSGNKSRHHSILHAGLIYSNGWWKNILDNYFEVNNDFFDLGLNGFISLIDSDMLWQDKVIRICGIWNQYTDQIGVKVVNRYKSQDFDCVFDLFGEEDVLLQCLFPQFHRQNCLQKCGA